MALPQLTRLERFLLTIRGEETDRPPVWIMRQAGRYMPEYMALRRQYSFRDLCLDPEAAVAAALLPRDLLDVDALIIFNDILIPLEDMGLTVEFPGGGPQIMDPPRAEPDLARFRAHAYDDPPVCASLRLLRERVGPDTPVLGFAGSPFTLMSYAVEGKMSRNSDATKALVFEEPELAHEMLSRIADTVVSYLVAQVERGGATAVQVFESAGNILAPHAYGEFATPWTQRVIERFRAACPGTPVILFGKGGCATLAAMESAGPDVLSIDWTMTLAEARGRTALALQGNLDPMAMNSPGAVEAQMDRMLEGFDWRRRWIANLGHGITPGGKVDAVRRMVAYVKNLAGKQGQG